MLGLKVNKMKIPVQTAKAGGGIFSTLFKFWWRHKLFLLFMAFILFNIILVGIQTKQPEKIFNDLGTRLFNPLNEIQESSNIIITNGYFLNPSYGVMKNIWKSFSFFWGLFFSLYTVWLWILLFRWGFIKLNDSERLYGTLVGFIIYILIQEVYLAMTDQSLFLPFSAIIDLFKAFPYIISDVSGFADKFTKLESLTDAKNTCNSSVCTV